MPPDAPDLLSETVGGLHQATAWFPAINGRHPSPASVWRWCTRGIRQRDGRVVRLEYGKAGRRLFTSKEAIGRFCRALTAPTETHVPPTIANPPPVRGEDRRRRAAEDAARELTAVGI